MNVKCLTQYLAVENIQLMEAITTFFFFGCTACGNLVPQPGIEPARPALEV